MPTMSKNRPRNADSKARLDALFEEMKDIPLSELRELFARLQEFAVENVERMAVCVKLMHEKGGAEATAGLPCASLLLRVAEGQVLAEVAFEFLGAPSRSLRAVTYLSRTDQMTLVKNNFHHPVPEKDPRGGYAIRMRDLRDEKADVVDLATAGGMGLRTPDEQKAVLESRKNNPLAPSAPSPDDELYGEKPRHPVTFRLTPTELKALRHLAADRGITEAALVRELVADGLRKAGALKRGRA